MNYIAGNKIILIIGYLFLTFGDEVVTYKVFHSIMFDYFRPIFLNDFETLVFKLIKKLLEIKIL